MKPIFFLAGIVGITLASYVFAQDSLEDFSIVHKEYFSSEFLNKLAFLWFDKDAKGLICPGNAIIEKAQNSDPLTKYDKESYQQFDNITVTVFGKNSYSLGDTVDIFHCDRFVKFKGKTANLVRRVAKAKVIKISNNQLTAILFKMWDIVSGGDRVDKTFRIQGKEIDSVVQPEKTIRALVFERVEETESPYLYQSFLCDRGAQDGVRFGDLFLVYPQNNGSREKHPSILACAVNVGEQSSTMAIEKMFFNSISAGDTLALVRHIRTFGSH